MQTLTKSLLATALAVATGLSQADDIPRTSEGLPDLTGNYDIATLTPLERPRAFGDNLYLTQEQAEKMAADEQQRMDEGDQASDPNRGAPPTGGDGSRGAAGNVGGYNTFWIDRGTDAFAVDGKFRTSIIYEPKNGRRPPSTKEGARRMFDFFSRFRHNKGVAWWLEVDGPGPYDNPESLTLSDRCLLGFGSTAGPPMLPVLYNNVKRIVQTPDKVMILSEMVHDARIIRLNSKHLPDDVRKWLGDSIGHWEGDTLVVETTNFTDQPALYGASRDLKVVERFTMKDKNTLLYNFTVTDPGAWVKPWSGELPFPKTEHRVYEYACHEGNYSMGNMLRGARLLENEAQQKQQGSDAGE
ncbi:MAG: hypothetical protein AAF512_12305 [Pseudomonadota bacterium]